MDIGKKFFPCEGGKVLVQAAQRSSSIPGGVSGQLDKAWSNLGLWKVGEMVIKFLSNPDHCRSL